MKKRIAEGIFSQMEADPLVKHARDVLHQFCADHAVIEAPHIGRLTMKDWKALCDAWNESGLELDKYPTFARTWLHLHRSAEGEL